MILFWDMMDYNYDIMILFWDMMDYYYDIIYYYGI